MGDFYRPSIKTRAIDFGKGRIIGDVDGTFTWNATSAGLTFAGVITFSGANTHSGANTFSGANTISGVATFSAQAIFSTGPSISNGTNLLIGGAVDETTGTNHILINNGTESGAIITDVITIGAADYKSTAGAATLSLFVEAGAVTTDATISTTTTKLAVIINGVDYVMQLSTTG